MAGDWIKMRDNLWDDPRVANLVDLTDSSEAAVIGSLYWLWSTADQHTEDGLMKGLTTRAIDRKTGVKGIGDALISIGWLADTPDGVKIVDFDRHNGSSAKKRCQTAKRVANHAAISAAANAEDTPENDNSEENNQNTNAACVSSALAREEKRREEKSKKTVCVSAGEAAPTAPTPPADAAHTHFLPEFREDIQTARPDLNPDAVWAAFCEHYPPDKRGRMRWRKWVAVERSMAVPGVDLAGPPSVADPDSKASVEAVALARGMQRWDSLLEPWAAYKTRVKTACQSVALQ